MEPDANYIVERIFNESFSQALTGYTWDNIDSANEPWSKYEQDGLNFSQIDTRTGKGRSWERLDYDQLSWTQIENKAYNWQQLECQEISFEIFRGAGTEKTDQGCTWLDLDDQKKDWLSMESIGNTWREWELLNLPGLSWDDIEARWLPFDEWEKKGLTFQELDIQRGTEKHREMLDPIPIGAVNAMYRIKAYGSDGVESDYLTTEQIPVIPIFYRNSKMEYPVTAGKRYRFLLKAQDVYDLNRVRMNLHYDRYLLELTNFAAHSTKNTLKPGDYSQEQLSIFSHFPGNVWFQSTKPVRQGECWREKQKLKKISQQTVRKLRRLWVNVLNGLHHQKRISFRL